MYRWNILPAKAHLFRKNLSKLSTGVYNQIIEGIGTYIEAVAPGDPILPLQLPNDATCSDKRQDESTSFFSRIRTLEEEIAREFVKGYVKLGRLAKAVAEITPKIGEAEFNLKEPKSPGDTIQPMSRATDDLYRSCEDD
ncbi:MAG: hypothetical protein L6R39_000029 [Caloplaca ligustica]|nr:MAG: hypothetical protein L6R39_000029 [Caloplaca ligustica]